MSRHRLLSQKLSHITIYAIDKYTTIPTSQPTKCTQITCYTYLKVFLTFSFIFNNRNYFPLHFPKLPTYIVDMYILLYLSHSIIK